MKRLTIIAVKRNGNIIDVQGVDVIALSPEEYKLLKEIASDAGFRELPID